jgi:hypothetical protein
MRYRVNGANEETGMEVSTSVTAQDLETAKKIARDRRILIESVRLEGGSATDFEEAPQPVNTAMKSPVGDRHAAILSSARELGGIATLVYVLSWISLAVGLLACAVFFSQAGVGAGLGAIFCGVVSTILLRALAALLVMFGSIGLAVRDLAMREADE